MKKMSLIGISLILIMIFAGIGSAEKATTDKNTSEYIWNGTWSSPVYSIYIIQNESGISGVYVPFDLDSYDPGVLEGNLSPDGKTYSGIWIEYGSNSYKFSDDLMSFNISGYNNPQGPMAGPAYYTGNASRIGGIVDPKNPWTGNYASMNKSYNITQNGTHLSGTNVPLANVNDNSGILNGTVSEDGMNYSGTWVEKGGFIFVISDDGLSINATITKSLEPDAIIEHMEFSR